VGQASACSEFGIRISERGKSNHVPNPSEVKTVRKPLTAHSYINYESDLVKAAPK